MRKAWYHVPMLAFLLVWGLTTGALWSSLLILGWVFTGNWFYVLGFLTVWPLWFARVRSETSWCGPGDHGAIR
jgi:hypothetical protein